MEQSVHGMRYRLGLLAAAAAIIAIGVAIKPKEKPVTPITEMESARLRRFAQERRLQELGEYISYAAQIAARSLVYLPDLQQTGVALNGHTVATGVRQIDAPVMRATSSARPVDLKLLARRPDVPVLFLRPVDGSAVPAAPRTEADTGDWVIAVALREDATPVFAYGLYENAAETRCGSQTYTQLRASIPLTPAFTGGGLFSLRGSLAGIVARCGTELVVLSVSSVESALSRPVAPNDWLQDRYGLRVAGGGNGGVQAIAVWDRGAANAAGIHPGDQLVRIDAQEVGSPEDLVAALKTDGQHDTTLRRGRRELRVRLALAPGRREVHLPAGLALADSAAGAVVRSVQADSPAARAGILPGDFITRYGGRAVDSADALAGAPVSARQPLVLTVERNGASFDARVAP